MNEIKVKVNNRVLIDISVEGNISIDSQELKEMLSYYLKLDREDRLKVVYMLEGMVLLSGTP